MASRTAPRSVLSVETLEDRRTPAALPPWFGQNPPPQPPQPPPPPNSDWIQIESFSLGAFQGSSNAGGGGGAGQVQIQDFAIMKKLDAASPDLFRQALNGGKPVKIDFLKQDAKVEPYLQIELENTLISSYNLSGQSGSSDRPMESISFNFAEVKLNYAEQKPDAGPKADPWSPPPGK